MLVEPVPQVCSVVGSVLFGADEFVANWVGRHIPEMAGRSFGPCATLGILRDGKLVGGVVYNNFHDHPEGGDITASVAFEPSCRISPATLKMMFSYPLLDLGCRRLSNYAVRSNKRSRQFSERTGFRLEGVKRKGFGREDVFMFGMLREECKFLRTAR